MPWVDFDFEGKDAAIRALPFFQKRFGDVSPIEVWGRPAVCQLSAGEQMVVLPNCHYLLTKGAVGLFQRGAMTRLLTPPAHYRSIEKTEGHDRLEALGDGVRVAVLDSRRFSQDFAEEQAECRIDAFQEQLDTLRVERRRLQRGLTDLIDPLTFAMPPGPYDMPSAKLYMFVVEDPAIRGLVPAQIRTRLTNDRYLLSFAQFVSEGHRYRGGRRLPEKHRLEYRETSILVPTWDRLGGGPGLFCARIHPDSLMAVVLGREVLRFPKRLAETWIEDRNPRGRNGAVWALDGAIAAKARWTGLSDPMPDATWLEGITRSVLGDDLDAEHIGRQAGKSLKRFPLEQWLDIFGALPIYVRHRRADFRRSRDWETDDLLRVPVQVKRVHALRTLEGYGLRLQLPRLRHVDPETWGEGLSTAEEGVAKSAWYAEIDLTLDAAIPVRDLRRPLWPKDSFRRGINILGRARRVLRGLRR